MRDLFNPDPKPTSQVVDKSKPRAFQYKTYKCKNCGKKYEKMIGESMRKHCSAECAYQLAIKKVDQARKKKEADQRKKTQKQKQDERSLTEWKDLLQVPINEMVRYLDKGKPCIGTGNTKGRWNAGHYHSRGGSDNLRFHLWNIHNQTVHSNKHRGGDPIRYIENIEKRYGTNIRNYLEEMHRHFPAIHLTCDDIRYTYLPRCRKIKKLLLDGKIPKDRWLLNNIIGIYDEVDVIREYGGIMPSEQDILNALKLIG